MLITSPASVASIAPARNIIASTNPGGRHLPLASNVVAACNDVKRLMRRCEYLITTQDAERHDPEFGYAQKIVVSRREIFSRDWRKTEQVFDAWPAVFAFIQAFHP
mgnify:CR=1 FL=1